MVSAFQQPVEPSCKFRLLHVEDKHSTEGWQANEVHLKGGHRLDDTAINEVLIPLIHLLA